MRELKATDKITQKMTRDGAVSENLATGEVEHISSREPETELSASSEESAGAAADLALRAAEHHEKKTARKAEKVDTQAVRDGSAARQRPSSRLQFTEEERADPALGKYIDRSDRAADRLDAAKAAIPTKKVLRTERVFDETAGKGKTQLYFEEVEKRPAGHGGCDDAWNYAGWLWRRWRHEHIQWWRRRPGGPCGGERQKAHHYDAGAQSQEEGRPHE